MTFTEKVSSEEQFDDETDRKDCANGTKVTH